MSRYRKVSTKIWSDAKFRRLSPIQPSGQALWLYLLTGPHTGIIPGLFRATEAGIAAELGWPLEVFAEVFAEVLREDLVKVDRESKLWWLPNAIRHNAPRSPNVVVAWAKEFGLLPECDLLQEAKEAMRADVSALSEPMAKSFAKSFGKSSPKSSGTKSRLRKQDQDQDQQQEDLPPVVPPSRPAAVAAPAVAVAPAQPNAAPLGLSGFDAEPGSRTDDASAPPSSATAPRTLFAGLDDEPEPRAHETATTAPKRATKPSAASRASACPASDASQADLDVFVTRWKLDPGHAEFAQWLDYHRAKRSLFADWSAAWRTWLRNGEKWGRASSAPRKGIQPPAAPDDVRWTPGDGLDWLEDGR